MKGSTVDSKSIFTLFISLEIALISIHFNADKLFDSKALYSVLFAFLV